MIRGRRNTSDRRENIARCERRRRSNGPSSGQFRDGRPASHGWNAALRLEANFGDDVSLQQSAELEYVSTNRIFYLCRGLRIGQNSCISRVLEMMEKLGRIHPSIVGRCVLSY